MCDCVCVKSVCVLCMCAHVCPQAGASHMSHVLEEMFSFGTKGLLFLKSEASGRDGAMSGWLWLSLSLPASLNALVTLRLTAGHRACPGNTVTPSQPENDSLPLPTGQGTGLLGLSGDVGRPYKVMFRNQVYF